MAAIDVNVICVYLHLLLLHASHQTHATVERWRRCSYIKYHHVLAEYVRTVTESLQYR